MTEENYVALTGDLTVILHYDVDALHVRLDQLGITLETERDGLPVRVEFPGADNRFKRHLLPPSALPIGGRYGAEGDPNALYVVRLVQVQVDMRRGLGSEGSGNAEYVLIGEAAPIASSVVRWLLDWARTRDRQAWLPPPHMEPAVVGSARLINEAGEMTHGYGGGTSVVVMLQQEQLPTGDMRAGLSGEEIPQAESLLAEARWAVWPTQDPDTKRAVLLAAIALEVKAPQVLLAIGHETSRKLLAVLMDRHDEAPMSVNFQLNTLAEVLLGGSLKAHDGRLAKGVKALYELRNDVTHRGQTPDVQTAREAVAAAEQVFEWLEGHLARLSAGARVG